MSNTQQWRAGDLVVQERPATSHVTKLYEVVCVCGGFGFPHGIGSTPRIAIVGKSLQAAGLAFRLIHCGPSPLAVNTQRAGVHLGIPYEYTTAVKRPSNAVARKLVYLRALMGVTIRLFQLRRVRRQTVIWLYIDGSANLFISSLCRLLGLPVVQELCEWWGAPDCSPRCSRLTRWLYGGPLFYGATGALVISKLIEQRVRKISARVNPNLLVHRLPSIVDAERFAGDPSAGNGSLQVTDWFVWCGDQAWIQDVAFLVRVIAVARRQGYRCRLKILGNFKESSRRFIAQVVAKTGVPPEDIFFTGYVDDRKLEESYRTAAALLLPLWDDDRSRTRLPNKLGEYLASGRPVVTCRVGDLTDFLTHRVNVYLTGPGDEQDFAEQLTSIIRDPGAATRIGYAGQETCKVHLDYQAHANALAQWFAECANRAR